MTNEIAVLADGNPLLSLRGPDGRWSARDVQKSGHVHEDWRNWTTAIKRGEVLLRGRMPGEDHVVSATKMVRIGSGATRELPDYSLDEWGLLAALQKSDIPEIDLWFTAAALAALGLTGSVKNKEKNVPRNRRVGNYTILQLAELAAIGVTVVEPDGTVSFGAGSVQGGQRFIDDHNERVKARALEKAEAARLSLPAPRVLVPAKEDDEAPWDYAERLAGWFNAGNGDWVHAAEFIAKQHVGRNQWAAELEENVLPLIREFARGFPTVAQPDWGLVKIAHAYADERQNREVCKP